MSTLNITAFKNNKNLLAQSSVNEFDGQIIQNQNLLNNINLNDQINKAGTGNLSKGIDVNQQQKTLINFSGEEQHELNAVAKSFSTIKLSDQLKFFKTQFNQASATLNSYLKNTDLHGSDVFKGKLYSQLLGTDASDSLNMILQKASALNLESVSQQSSGLDITNALLADESLTGQQQSKVLLQSANQGSSSNVQAANFNVAQTPAVGVGSATDASMVIFNTNATANGVDDLFPNADPITRAAMILLLFVNTTMSSTMNGYLGVYTGVKNNMDTLTKTQNDMQEVTNFMASNSGQSINVFGALWLYNQSPQPTTGTIPGTNVTLPSTLYSNFLTSCPQFMSDLQSAYRQYNPDAANDATDLASLATGDNQSASPAISGQSQVMQYFVNPANAAGYGIQGLSAQPIFSSSWTNSSTAGSDPALYQASRVSGDSAYAQLTFTSGSVSQFIGSNGTQGGGGVLGGINQAVTAGTTSNNTLQAEMNQLSNSINVIWNTVASNLIPNTKIQF